MSDFRYQISDTGQKLSGIRHPNSDIRSGFTLIELLIVITILGILAAGLFVLINPLKRIKQSRDSVRKAELQQVKRALELYKVEHGRYPYLNPAQGYNDYCDDVGAYDVYSTSGGCADGFLPILVAEDWLKSSFKDPKSTGDMCVPKWWQGKPCYNYAYIADTNFGAQGQTYILHTRLEDEKDPELATNNCFEGESPIDDLYCIRP